METYLSIEEVAKYLGIAERTVRKWVLNREIPYRKIKKVIRFRVSEIEKWIDNGGGTLPEAAQICGQECGQDGDLYQRDIISLDELAELEQAEEAISETGEEE